MCKIQTSSVVYNRNGDSNEQHMEQLYNNESPKTS